MKFPYVDLGKDILRPIVDVIVIHNNMIVGYECLVDSGSDYNIFDEKLANTLDIDIKSGNERSIVGVGKQKLIGYEHNLNLRVIGKSYSAKVIFCKDTSGNAMGILGNQGFFNKFDINFRYRKKYFEIF